MSTWCFVGSSSITKNIEIQKALPTNATDYGKEYINDYIPPETVYTFKSDTISQAECTTLTNAANTRFSVLSLRDQGGTTYTGRLSSLGISAIQGVAGYYQATVTLRSVANEDNSTTRVVFSVGG